MTQSLFPNNLKDIKYIFQYPINSNIDNLKPSIENSKVPQKSVRFKDDVEIAYYKTQRFPTLRRSMISRNLYHESVKDANTELCLNNVSFRESKSTFKKRFTELFSPTDENKS